MDMNAKTTVVPEVTANQNKGFWESLKDTFRKLLEFLRLYPQFSVLSSQIEDLTQEVENNRFDTLIANEKLEELQREIEGLVKSITQKEITKDTISDDLDSLINENTGIYHIENFEGIGEALVVVNKDEMANDYMEMFQKLGNSDNIEFDYSKYIKLYAFDRDSDETTFQFKECHVPNNLNLMDIQTLLDASDSIDYVEGGTVAEKKHFMAVALDNSYGAIIESLTSKKNDLEKELSNVLIQEKQEKTYER